jgi:Aspartyl/Asparaginyl beta-hydroxylase
MNTRASIRRRLLGMNWVAKSQPIRPFSSIPLPPSDKPPIAANVIQGPSLLQTSVPRSNPSLMFLPGLRSLPFWTSYDAKSDTNRIAYQDPTLTHVVSHLQANVEAIREEYCKVAPTLESDYKLDAANEHSLHKGQWDWHSYMTKGQMQGHFGQYFPETTKILQALRQTPDNGLPTRLLLEEIPFGYAFFSTLHPQSKIQAHVSPMNLRLRIHLPLEVPVNGAEEDSDGMPKCGIRVANQVQTWTRDKALVLDDSYDHEVWNNTDHKRVLFLLDMWHPDISLKERMDIVGMFKHAHDQGWYGKPSQ